MKLYTGVQGVPTLQGAALIVPAVTVGNVGQLATDLLITTSKATLVGTLADPTLLSVAGARAFQHAPGLALSLQLFALPGGRLYLLQQRAPPAPGLQQRFAQSLAAWAQEAGFAKVWVLGSVDASLRRDSQLTGPQLRFWSGSCAGSDALQQACIGAGLESLEAAFFEDKPLEARALPPWPLARACEACAVPSAALLTFTAEGDNVPDAEQLAVATCKAVAELEGLGGAGGAAGRWERPESWQFVYGPRQVPAY